MSDAKLTILSFGAGQDSTAILYKIHFDPEFRAKYVGERLLIIMSDTGDEHYDTREHVEEVKAFCSQHGYEFVFLDKSMGYHRQAWAKGLRGFYRAHNVVGSSKFPKTCTDNLKIQPMYRFIEEWLHRQYGVRVRYRAGRIAYKEGFKDFARQYGKIDVIIGYTAEPKERRRAEKSDAAKGDVWVTECIRKVYPLIDLGYDRKACQDYIASVGKRVPPPSNCILCPFKSKAEIVWTARTYPGDFADWVDIEAKKIEANLHMGEKNYGVNGRTLLMDYLAKAEREFGHLTIDQLNEHRMSHGHCVSSAY